MRNIFVHTVVSPLDEYLVEKPTAKAFIKESQESGHINTSDYVNRHDYFSWMIRDLPKPYRREIKTNITTENYLYPVSVPLAQVLDIESEFWTELKLRFEPLPDKNVFVSMSEKAALMLNGATFERFFNHAEFSPCISDIWECGPQNELVGFKTDKVWLNFVEKCSRHLVPSKQYKNERFYIKCNSHEDYEIFLNRHGYCWYR